MKAAATFRELLDAGARDAVQACRPLVLAPETGEVVSYSAMRARARGLAAFLEANGVPPGAVVSFMLPNGVSAATLFLGAMYGGYIVSPINLLAQDAQLEYVLAHSETRIVFTAAEFVPRLERLLSGIGTPRRGSPILLAVDVDRLDSGIDEKTFYPHLDATDPAMLMYTSGTTGMPKGVLLSHANMLHAGRAVADAHALTPHDRVLSSLPLYHINGQCIATVSPLVSGGSIVMPHRFSASQWWDWVERFRPTWLNFVPTIIAYLLHGAELTAAQREACSRIRFGRSASAPLPPGQHRAFEERFGVGVIEAMGLTECASAAFANPLDPARRKYGSAGMPLGLEARVVGPPPERVARADAEAGEIELRGPNVMLGYYKSAEANARALDAQGWLATGDLGYRDVDGFYFITGRLKELIIKGGENIAPREIDEALLKHPDILEAAAVGIPDPDYGQEILACIVRKPGTDIGEDEVRAHCVRELGKYKTPKELLFVDALPKGPSGKVQRLKLLELRA